MLIKKAVTWNMKKPPSHSRRNTNPRTRNMLRLFLSHRYSTHPCVGDPVNHLRASGNMTIILSVPAVVGNWVIARNPILLNFRCPQITKVASDCELKGLAPAGGFSGAFRYASNRVSVNGADRSRRLCVAEID